MTNTTLLRLTIPDPDNPGTYFDALTDTNPDHFSLIADEENVLIKQLIVSQGTIDAPGDLGYTMLTIAHNLGYIPLVFPYADLLSNDTWGILTNQFNAFEVPIATAAVDTKNLYIVNFGGYPNLPVKYRIFYDDMSNDGSPEFEEGANGIKFVRPGKDARSKNPNDYIMHTSLNNLKILHQERQTIALTSGGNTIAHNADIDSPFEFFAFIKFPDGKTACAGLGAVYSYDESKWVQVSADADNIYIGSSGSFPVDISYFFFGTGKDGTLPSGIPKLAWTKDGKDVFKSTNPDDFRFHSDFPTLKYYASGSHDMGSVNNTTVFVLSHGLGYVPFFAGYTSDLEQFDIYNGNSEPVYALAPYYLGRSSLGSPTQDVAAFIYADDTNLYFKAYFQANAVGTSFPFDKFFYKLFKNNLGL